MTGIQDHNSNIRKDDGEVKVHGSKYEQFVPRNSLLTDLYKTSHILCIYRIFAVAVLMFYVRSILVEITEGKSLTFGFKYVLQSAEEIHVVAGVWLYMFGLTLLVYPGLCLWAKTRTYIALNIPVFHILGIPKRFWDVIGVFGIAIYYVLLLYVPLRIRGVSSIPVNNLLVSVEQVRLAMKTHGFIRSNTPRVLAFKTNMSKEYPLPKFRQFLYYYFAPTFVYRDDYPRTGRVDFKALSMWMVEFVVELYWFSCLIGMVVERYKNFGLQPESYWTLLLHVLDTMLISPFVFVAGNYTILHTWSNIWGEMLRFADRQFYEDWWNSTDYSRYYRVWNLVVYGYLHTYLYKDFMGMTKKNKIISTCLVVLISAVVHEYVISLTFGFFMPILFLHFGICSLPLSFIKLKYSTFTNLFFVFSIILGTGIEVSFYAMEYFARVNCPGDGTLRDYFRFRMLTCNGLDLTE